MDPNTLIQATVAVAAFVGGMATGVFLQRQVVINAEGHNTTRWRWLTPTRLMAAGVVMIAVFGILTAVSVRSCQSEYNARFTLYLGAARAASELTADSLIALADGVLDPTASPAQRAATLEKFRNDLRDAKAKRQANPLPPPPEC